MTAVERHRLYGLAAALFAAVATLNGSAHADCGSDMQKLAQDRNAQLQIVNAFAQSFHGKPMDPQAFCVKSAGLIRAESSLIAYMEKNKDWCSFPDEAIAQLKEHHAKNASFNSKACTVAAQMKKMKEQAAQGAAAARRPSRCRPDRFDRRAATGGEPAGRPAGELGDAAHS